MGLPGEEPKPMKMGSQLSPGEVSEYTKLVMEFRDIFAWSYKDLKTSTSSPNMRSRSSQGLSQSVKKNGE